MSDALDFLKWLRPDGPWLLTAIIPDGETTTATCRNEMEVSDFVAEHDGKCNIYYTLNPTKRAMSKKPEKDDIAAAEFIHGDLDPEGDETPEQAKERILKAIEATGLPKPSADIDSGNGIQLLWKLGEQLKPATAVEPYNKMILRAFGAGGGTWNVDRLLRLPGTTNLPNKVKREKGRVICSSSILRKNGATYSLDDFPKMVEEPKAKVSGAEIPKGELPEVDVDLLPCTDAVKKIIREGGGDKFPSRSEACWHVARELLRTGADVLMVVAVLLDPDLKISEHVLDQSNPRRCAERTVMRAKLSLDTGDAPDFSESALALRFAERHEHHLRFVAAWGKWMIWDGTRWQRENTRMAVDMAHTICREAAVEFQRVSNKSAKGIANHKTTSGVERLASADRRLAASEDQWDQDDWLLNTPAGVIDLRTAKMRPAEPDDYMTKITAVAPDKECSIKLWLKVLKRSMGDDDQMVSYLRRLFGYCLTGVTTAETFAFFHGEGANGKTKIIEAVGGCMGDYRIVTQMETFLASREQRHLTEIADLCGARLVTAVETDEGRRWDTAKIKALTGGDTQKARFMHKDLFTFTPKFKPIVHGNKKPRLRSVDEGIRRRLHLVPFEVIIPEEERDEALGEKLKAEWPGILAWMIDGCIEWQAFGLAPPNKVINATDAYFASQDAIGRWIEEKCHVDVNAATKRDTLWLSWKDWAEDAGEYVGRNGDFYEALEKRGLGQKTVKGERQFEGIAIGPAPVKQDEEENG